MSILHKKERVLQAVIDNETKAFYVVPNWEVNEDARLINMIRLMQSFNEECCYRVDLYAVTDLEEQIHQSFEKPLLFLRNIGKTATGQFNSLSFISECPNGLHMPDAPQSLSNWTTTFTSEELAAFCRLPVLYDGENIELPKETALH